MRYSKQRESIIVYLNSTKSHPTAEAIYEDVRHEYPNISLGTVYRNLTQLVDNGIIRKISVGDGKEHYDGDTSAHSHFYCRICSKIFDIEMEPTKQQLEDAAKTGIGKVETAAIIFTGVCLDCTETGSSETA